VQLVSLEAAIGIVGSVISGAAFVITLMIKLDVANLRCHIYENFLTKDEFYGSQHSRKVLK
jgi:hypothetical protein